MPEVETKITPNEEEEEEDDYIEEEDEDFQPERDKLGDGSDDSDASDGGDGDDDNESKGKGRSKVDYSRIESESGGLIKTRRARQAEEEYAKTHKYESLAVESIPAKVNSIWEELQQASRDRFLSSSGKVGSVLGSSNESGSTTAVQQEDKILIERNYKFAGETINEKKWVPRSSAEGQEYLNSLKFKQQAQQAPAAPTQPDKTIETSLSESRKHLRRPLKRPPLLEQIISGGLRPKLTTLEKSQLDWASYVDRAGLNDELVLHNKDGFLARQEFLQRVGSAEDERYKELRRQQLAQQLQQDGGAS
ncbi:Swc5p [Saccharomyces paradoxus]|uniref:SWR1-complex protein 5 n=1 Tax=Saccharomyces paradoxus TaxID=27291 RepID=A0A8B8ULZ4_SACPA|nr:Swc5 [Saccharomyces paradoxus]QHS71788.1 Swc5 [Saccharomyces paradoxus]